MEWRPAGWSVCLPLLISPCTIKSRSSLLALAHLSCPGKRTVKRLWWWCGWNEGWPRPRQHCVRWGPSSPSPKGAQQLPHFSADVYCGQMAKWIKVALGMEVGLSPGDIVLDRDPPPSQKRVQLPNFWPMSIVAKRLDGSRCDLVQR